METDKNIELQPLVDVIARRGMVEPAIFFLEMSKPLIGCLRELYSVSEPILHTFVTSSALPALKVALQSSDDTERLIEMLEQSRMSRDSSVQGERG